MKYLDLSKRDLSQWLTRYPHSLILSIEDQKRLLSDPDNHTKIPPYSFYEMKFFDSTFKQYDLAWLNRQQKNHRWWHTEQLEPTGYYKYVKSKVEFENTLKLYFKTKDDALMFKLTWG